MRRTIFLYLAIFWTGVILVLSLENANDFRKIDIENLDKVVHAGLHFVFTSLWFLYFKKKFIGKTNLRLLTYALLGSLLFGIIIELLQKYFTTTRNADIYDVYADLFGAAMAVIAVLLLNRYNRFVDKI